MATVSYTHLDVYKRQMGNTPQKKIVTHRFEPTSKYVLLFIGGLALSLVIAIWGNFTQWREYQDWGEADLKYRALKMVLPSDDPNVCLLYTSTLHPISCMAALSTLTLHPTIGQWCKP